MRTMIRITVPNEAGNKAALDGTLSKTIADTIQRLKPEAAYFYTEKGIRTSIMIADVNDVSDIPVIAEPLFMSLNAAVEFFPVMNAEDLKKGLTKAMQAR